MVSTFINGNIHTYICILWRKACKATIYMCVYVCTCMVVLSAFSHRKLSLPKVQEISQKRAERTWEPEDGRSVEKCCGCSARELTQLAYLHKTCTRWSLLRLPAWSREGFLWPHPLTEELPLTDGSSGRQGLFSLDCECWLVAHVLVGDSMLMYIWAE